MFIPTHTPAALLTAYLAGTARTEAPHTPAPVTPLVKVLIVGESEITDTLARLRSMGATVQQSSPVGAGYKVLYTPAP